MLQHHQRRDVMLVIGCRTLLSVSCGEIWMECSLHTWRLERGGAKHVRAVGSAGRLQAVETRALNTVSDVAEKRTDGSDVREFLSAALASIPRRAGQSARTATSAPTWVFLRLPAPPRLHFDLGRQSPLAALQSMRANDARAAGLQ